MHYVCDCTADFVYKSCEFPVPTGPNFIVDNFLKVFNTFVSAWEPTEDEPDRLPKNAEDVLNNAIVFSLIWGIGCQIDEATRPKINEFFTDLIYGEEVCKKHGLDCSFDEPLKMKHNLGDSHKSLFDICFKEQDLKWISWINTIPQFETPVGKPFSEVIVPT